MERIVSRERPPAVPKEWLDQHEGRRKNSQYRLRLETRDPRSETLEPSPSTWNGGSQLSSELCGCQKVSESLNRRCQVDYFDELSVQVGMARKSCARSGSSIWNPSKRYP